MNGQRCRCFRGSPNMPEGYWNMTPRRWWLPRSRLTRRRGRFFTQAPPRTLALNSPHRRTDGDRSTHCRFRRLYRVRSDCGCPPGRPALRRLGVERRIVADPRAKTGWDGLTDSELKVVNLIAQGATNRSVAPAAPIPPQ